MWLVVILCWVTIPCQRTWTTRWWLVRATYVVDGRFFFLFLVTFFARWREQCAYMLIHVQLLCTLVINMQGRGSGFQTLENSDNSENFKFKLRWQGALTTVSDLMNGSHLELLKMVVSQNREFDIKCRFWSVFMCLTHCWCSRAYDHWRSITEYPWLPIVTPSNQSVGENEEFYASQHIFTSFTHCWWR